MRKKGFRIDANKRFNNKVSISTNGCWNWTGAINSTGYGSFQFDGKVMGAHRASYLIHKGIIAKGMLVCHTCDNPICVNPDHLFLGTDKDNVHDKIKKGRNTVMKGEVHPLSKFSSEEILTIRRLYKEGIKSKELARRYNTKRPYINDICRRAVWKHI